MKRRSLGLSIAAFVVTVALVGCGGGSASSPPPASATVMVRTVGPLGPLLVDAAGRTLYLFEADTTTASTCSGACAQTWHPLTIGGPPQAGTGASAGLLGTTSRSDGSTQVTYGGHPLYLFIGDTNAGDTTGEGAQCFGGGWDVVSPAGAKIPKPGG